MPSFLQDASQISSPTMAIVGFRYTDDTVSCQSSSTDGSLYS